MEVLSFFCLLSIRKLRHVGYDPNVASLSTVQKARLSQFVTYIRSGGKSSQNATVPDIYGRIERSMMDGPTGWVTAPPEANLAGMRDNREYNSEPPAGITRILAFGDSSTYGDEVALGDTWAKRVTAAAPSVEVLNYGVRAYGLDQAYLRYLKEGFKYHPSAVIIGYMVGDIERDVVVFRLFCTRAPFDFWAKPRFQLRDGQLTLLRNPLFTVQDYENLLRNDSQVIKELGQNDYYYQTSYVHGRFDFLPSVRLAKVSWRVLTLRLHHPIYSSDGGYNVKSEAYQVTAGIFDAFYSRVLEDGALPIIVVFDARKELQRIHEGQVPREAPLLEHFRSKGYRFLETRDALETVSGSTTATNRLFSQFGHYSPLGNQIVADYIVAQLKKWDLMDTSKLARAALAERKRLSLELR